MKIMVVGYCFNPPDRVLVQMSRKLQLERKAVAFAPEPEKRTHKVVVHHGIQSLRRALKEGRWKKATHLVFDTPVNLHEFRIPAGDMEVNDLQAGGFQQKPLELEGKPFEGFKERLNVIEESVELLKQQATFLNRFMTFVYSTPRATHQTVIKVEVCKWMLTKKRFPQLLKAIATSPETILNERQIKRLEDLTTSEVANLYREAMQEGGCSAELSVKYEVSEYEINYMRAVAAKGR